jgi:hypothetical protein
VHQGEAEENLQQAECNRIDDPSNAEIMEDVVAREISFPKGEDE